MMTKRERTIDILSLMVMPNIPKSLGTLWEHLGTLHKRVAEAAFLELPCDDQLGLHGGDSEIAEKILNTLKNGPAKPSQLRHAAGIKSRIHFIRYYLAPMLERGLIARTDPDHPQSPQQQYKLA